ncbi:succinate-semialdehyde dehydrogenase [Adhaeribacter aerolatus]|uniref:Succinate-semialdehyde dehydrogenase n=1 Tax=Adhaeribacter aerolatus TaxID=670289 RepID=A0A512AZ52_9BACT|nr:NAD-dependent succinate-semialdehyde dehydrogenase [Adhaeribacter aerolatus]GEO05005.1 succinate-semialdehyde dehydrogenase [Adhaeribacter aerolatus]
MAIKSINPANNSVLKTYEYLTDAALEKALHQADETFRSWRQTSFAERTQLMNKCADLLEKDNRHYAELMTLEMGKPIKQATSEINKCAAVCRYYAQHAEKFLQDEIMETEASRSFVSYEPLGAVLAVMPWNFPYWQVFRFAAPALMAGNVGILKHASNVPQCALAIEAVFRQAGFPEGAFTTLLIPSDKVEKVIQDERIKAVTLTGSEGAGSSVAQVAGREIKKTVLELGGSDPFLVLADADLDKAVETAVNSRLINTGQSCIAAKRFMVVEPVAETFLQKMKALMESKRTGDLMDEACDYGPLARRDLAEDLQKQVDESVAKGAKIYLNGGHRNPGDAYFHPMILTDIKPGMPAYEDELFGPVALVFVVKDEAEAIRIANDHKYGLGATIFTQDLNKGEKLARQIESGNVFINAMVQSAPGIPFGGIKKSGYGRELSYVGIREFINQKTIWIG